MSMTGEIKNLYSDKDKTKVLLPRTKTKAVSDENGTSLDVLLDGKVPVISKYYEAGTNAEIDSLLANILSTLDRQERKRISIAITNTGLVLPSDNWFFDLERNVNSYYITATNSVYVVKRYYKDLQFGEWVWENPPMKLGVEYRLAEYYNSKPVYVKVVNFGALPNKTTANVSNTLSNVESIVSCIGTLSNGTSLPTNNTFCYSTKGLLYISTTADYSSYTATVKIKYTKTS